MYGIAARAWCSKATLYGYFPSKTELFLNVVIMKFGGQIGETLTSLPQRRNQPSREVLAEAGIHFLRTANSAEAQPLQRLIAGTMTRRADAANFWRLGARQALDAFETYLNAAAKVGLLRIVHVRSAAQQVLALYEAEVLWIGSPGFAAPLDEEQIPAAVQRAVRVFCALTELKRMSAYVWRRVWSVLGTQYCHRRCRCHRHRWSAENHAD